MTPTLGPEQAAIYRLLNETNNNYFITGKAGTGKSMLLQYFVANTTKNIAVTAPTGVAAINVGGQTIHSFFGLDIDIQDVNDKEVVKKIPYRRKQVIKELDTLVIDEISMVSADVMDMIDHRMQIARKSKKPFGGCQVIVFGDLYQLPPVVSSNEEKEFLRERYNTCFFFGAPGFKKSGFKTVELSHIYRQNDEYFISLLNDIRLGERDPVLINALNEFHREAPDDGQFVTLCATNATANRINKQKLAEIDKPEREYEGVIEGKLQDSWLPTPKTLTLKEGALVMMTKNDTITKDRPFPRWVNGTLATVTKLENNSIEVEIKGETYKVPRADWEKNQYNLNNDSGELEKEVVANFNQFPLKLAYAITIHKSQGQSYDQVKIDLDHGAFAPGQVYVALSRCRSLEGLYLSQDLHAKDIIVSPAVVDYMNNNAMVVDDPKFIDSLTDNDAAPTLF